MKPIKETINEYTKHLKTEQYSQLTADQYHRILTSVVDTMGVKNISQLSEKKLLQYRSQLLKDEVSTKTKNLKLTILRSFLVWANGQKISDVTPNTINPIRDNNKKAPLSLISRDELKQFLSSTEDKEEDLIVNVLYATGLRISELTQLRVKQVDTEFDVVGKGSKNRTIFLPLVLVDKIKDYASKQARQPDSRIFQMTNRTIQRRIKQRGEAMGLSQVMTPHKLRHLYATHLYENGADLRTLQEILGHSSINTTQIYTHVNTEKMRDTIRNCQTSLV